jgi:hypothetical protein
MEPSAATMLVKKAPRSCGITSAGNHKEVAMLSPARRFPKRFHPEGIPWPWCLAYDAGSGTEVFRRQYELLACPTRFREAETRFVGVLCCLALKKGKRD